MHSGKCLRNLITYLAANTHRMRAYKNNTDIEETSVTLILRNTNIEEQLKSKDFGKNCLENLKELEQLDFNHIGDSEILFIKRETNIRDKHSGEIAFPGGKLNDNESDFEASVREAKEEIGVELGDSEKFIYLGQAPVNFFAYYRNNRKTLISLHFFLQYVTNESNNTSFVEILPNVDEVDFAFYEELSHFLYPRLDLITFKKSLRKPSNVFAKRGKYFSKYWLDKFIYKNLSHYENCYYTLENGEELYGLTFYFVMYLLRIMTNHDRSLRNLQLEELLWSSLQYKIFYSNKTSHFKHYLINKLYYFERLRQYEEI